MYREEDYLQLSGLQHFKFCRRRWALIHIENLWADNFRTVDGSLMHKNAHDKSFTETRKNCIITRGMNVSSATLGISGECDVLEFHESKEGIPLPGKNGLWQPFPVEYKRGVPNEQSGDYLQLCAQAMCLEEMLCCTIPEGAMHYGEIHLTLDGENVVANKDKQVLARYPLHTLSGIISFSYSGASPALMGACAEREVGLCFCTPRGKFLARVSGTSSGNVLLRRTQYRVADDPPQACRLVKNIIFGKLYNSRWGIERTCRDHALRVNVALLKDASSKLQEILKTVYEQPPNNYISVDGLRGLEGTAARIYFDVFDERILSQKDIFFFEKRSKRPPLNAVNALLSFAYSLLANDCANALEAVGLDAYVGFLHTDKPGRRSLSLDLMEEMRACVADRFVLTLINNRMMGEKDFEKRESGAVFLTDDGRRVFFKQWQERKKEVITHPFLKEKVEWGMVPYIQALLLARYLRDDLDEYPPFLWK